MWGDTTTLYTGLLRGHVVAVEDPDAEIVASGILRISPLGFLRQLTTFRAGGRRSPIAQVAAIARFDALFLGHLWEVYGLHRVCEIFAARMKRPDRGSGGRGDEG